MAFGLLDVTAKQSLESFCGFIFSIAPSGP